MPVIPFFPNFPRFVNTGVRRRRRREYQAQYSNLRIANSQGLELLGSACQSQVSPSSPLGAGHYLPQQYPQQQQQQQQQQHPQTPQTQYAASQYAAYHFTQSQPVSPFTPIPQQQQQQRPMTAPQPGSQDAFLLPSLQQSTMGAASAYPLPSQSALSSPSIYHPSTASMYEPALVTPIIPSSSSGSGSSSGNYLPYISSNHGHSQSLGSNPTIYELKSSNPRTLPQPMSAGRVLSTLGAIPPSGLSFFGLTPEQQAFFQQRRLPPPPPPQPRIYSFENSTQTTIAETLALTKENKEKRAGSPRSRERSESPADQSSVSESALFFS
ncbi:hypothetical protein DRE_00103 [Drechslerella stenobrocha 248]|uniref:Uncharacterized protein n=1 Tax=Drechslerella stenobrocha 248 TaxID=1043628 RepID=W7I905_9PEZI|nr:hypothetical protein DRE_00103 [Drechslerella stenobrocha 248]